MNDARCTCQHCAWTYSGTEEDALAAWRTHLLIHPNQSGRCKVCGAETAARGRFANMCEEHRGTKPAEPEPAEEPAPDPEPQANGNGSVSLIELAKNIALLSKRDQRALAKLSPEFASVLAAQKVGA